MSQMKSTVIVRNVDKLGRIVIPMELRRERGIVNGDPVEIFADGENVVMRKHRASCVFCEGNEDMDQVLGKPVCGACLKRMRLVGR